MGRIKYDTLLVLLLFLFLFGGAFSRVAASSEEQFVQIDPGTELEVEKSPLFLNLEKKSSPTVRIGSVKGWRRLGAAEMPSLSLAAWVPTVQNSGRECSDGSPSRITAYIVDVGRFTPQKLMQAWFPRAIRYDALGQESEFILISAEQDQSSDHRIQTVVAVSGDSNQLTPLIGRTPGLRLVFVAESTALNKEALQQGLRQVLTAQIPTAAAPMLVRRNQPIVKLGKTWSPGVEKHLEIGVKAEQPEAMMSLAYGLFLDAKGLVPGGQKWVVRAAEKGHLAARLELIRLKKRGLLTVDLSNETLSRWQSELSELGNSEARYLQAYQHLMQNLDQPKAEHVRPLHKLGACGQPEARRHYAKTLMESFKPKTARKGQYLVVDLMLKPPLQLTVPPLIRQTRADWDAPEIEELKQAALLRSACTGDEDPDPSLYVKKEDFSLKKRKRVLKQSERQLEVAKQIQLIDQLANGGSKAKVKQALSVACNWMGAEVDRERLIVELRAREIGLGQWVRMRSCDHVTDERTRLVCRDQQLKKTELVHQIRMRKLRKLVPQNAIELLAKLESSALDFHQNLLSPGYERAGWAEKRELDDIASQLNQEFAALVSSTISGQVSQEIRDVVTSRSLLLVPEAVNGSVSVARKPATVGLLKFELEKLKAKLTETLAEVDAAALDDLSPRAKEGFKLAHASWQNYLKSYEDFATAVGASTLEPNVWLHMQGLYFFEKIKEIEMSRAKVMVQAISELDQEADDLNRQLGPGSMDSDSSREPANSDE